MKAATALLMLSFAFLSAAATHADTFGSGANTFDIEFAPVVNSNNPDDTAGDPSPAGKVEYAYRTGKYEISREMITKANYEGGWHAVSNYLSDHPGGCNFLMADASVTFLSEVIDMAAYLARSTIAADDIFNEYLLRHRVATGGPFRGGLTESRLGTSMHGVAMRSVHPGGSFRLPIRGRDAVCQAVGLALLSSVCLESGCEQAAPSVTDFAKAPWLFDPQSQIDLLKHEEYRLRRLAASNLGNMGALAAEALPSLERLAKTDPEFKVRDSAREAAAKIRAAMGQSSNE
jgi:prepilin-type processing-associated H-X9-DG protein